MNDFRYQELLETGWRRALTESEERELLQILAARPGLRSGWLEEQALSRAWRGLADAPVPSNFAALVERQIARETGAKAAWAGSRPWRGFFRFYLPRVAFGAVLLGAVIVGTREYEALARLRMARSVAEFSTAAAAPKIEWLENFDAIHELRAAPPMDEELYSLLRTVSATRQMRLTPPTGNQLLALSP